LLRARQSRERIPIGAIFTVPVHTSPGAHLAYRTIGTGSVYQVVKQPGHSIDHPPHLVLTERVELYLYSLSGPSWPVLGRTLPLPLLIQEFTNRRRQACVATELCTMVPNICGPSV